MRLKDQIVTNNPKVSVTQHEMMVAIDTYAINITVVDAHMDLAVNLSINVQSVENWGLVHLIVGNLLEMNANNALKGIAGLVKCPLALVMKEGSSRIKMINCVGITVVDHLVEVTTKPSDEMSLST